MGLQDLHVFREYCPKSVISCHVFSLLDVECKQTQCCLKLSPRRGEVPLEVVQNLRKVAQCCQVLTLPKTSLENVVSIFDLFIF